MSYLPIINWRFIEEWGATPIYFAAFVEILEHIGVAPSKDEGVFAFVVDENMNT